MSSTSAHKSWDSQAACFRRKTSCTIVWITGSYNWSFLGIKIYKRLGKHSRPDVAGMEGCIQPVPYPSDAMHLGIVKHFPIYFLISSAFPPIPFRHVLNTDKAIFLFLFLFFLTVLLRQSAIAEMTQRMGGKEN